MVEIGRKIKELRIGKGYTQEQLGKLLGVSTQAVSKWERGGTPDIELLPDIADVFGVSIDALFFREVESVESAIAETLHKLPAHQAFERAFRMCWAVNAGLSREGIVLANCFDDMKFSDTEHKYFSKLSLDEGMIDIRLAKDFRYFFLMPEPEGGINEKIESIENLQKLFSVFADINVLKILFYMYTRLNTHLDATLISKNTGIDVDSVREYMRFLEDNNLVDITVINTAKGEDAVYTFRQECSVVPFLCFADEIHKKLMIDYWVEFERTKPLFT